MNRSYTYECDICGKVNILEQHHINGRKFDNCNDWWNIANICADCHTKIHNGIIIVEKWISTTEGKKLIWHNYKEKSITGENALPYLFQ